MGEGAGFARDRIGWSGTAAAGILPRRLLPVAVLAAVAWWAMASAAFAQEELRGDTGAHDPSTLIKDGDRYYFFLTSTGIEYKWSDNLLDWNFGGRIFPAGPPAWTTIAVPAFEGTFWAPDVAYFNGRYHVYYSISEWATIDSAIGLVTSPSLNTPLWTDRGKVIQSDASWEAGPDTDTTSSNCIDPDIFQDADGRIWLVFGSYSDGIHITEIDPATGQRLGASPFIRIANNGPTFFSNTTEGASLYKRGLNYYLFINYGGCCALKDSTYNIRVGRSMSVTGPYFDRDGVNMNAGGGTMLLETSGRFIGPGHAGILNDNGTEWFSYHYYSGTENGFPRISISRLSWDASGWPVLPNDWSALYPFNLDAREHTGHFNGALRNGASIVEDAHMGRALELDGIDDYVGLSDLAANAKTFATWVKWDGGGDWQRIFDFGNDTTAYMFLTPRAGDGSMRFAITTAGAGGEQTLSAPFPLPINTWCHLAVTLDGDLGVFYFNGEALASAPITIRPWQMLARVNDIGRSKYTGDPAFAGRIASFRVFARALAGDEIRRIAWADPALAHRYSFDAGMRDTVGMAHGRLMGSATIADGTLRLPGTTGSYAQLPGGLVTGSGAVTAEFWADFGSNENWARVFDFGNFTGAQGRDYFFLTTGLDANTYRLDLDGVSMDVPGGSLNNRSVHVACIVDPADRYGAVYFNGELVKEQTISWPALGVVDRGWSFLGRSLFAADPYLHADIDEFRIYDGRLTPQQIAGNHAAGPDALFQPTSLSMTYAAGQIALAWPGYPAGFGLEFATDLETTSPWIPLPPRRLEDGYYTTSFLTGSIDFSNMFFRLRR